MPNLLTDQVIKYLNAEEANPQAPAIKRWEDVYYGVSLHTKGVRPKFKDLSVENGGYITPPGYRGEKYQYLFEKFLMARYPRENDVTRQWRLSQYRPLTKAPFSMLTDILIGAIFQDSQYTLTLPDEDDHKYIWGNSFQDRNLIQYFADIILPNIIEDPNGLIVRIPSKPFNEQTAEKIEVDIWFVNSKDIVYYTPSDLVFKKGGYAYWVNTLAIFRFIKEKDIYGFDQGYFLHQFGKLPVSIAGGNWNTDGFYDSYYDKAIPVADEFINSFSAEQMTDKEASHPFIQQVGEDCPECLGLGQITLTCDDCPGGIKQVTCPKCKGRKTISVNPGDRLIVPPEMATNEYNDMIKIISPDTGVNEYHRKKNDEIMDMILRALNLLNIDAAQSGKAKAIDQEKLYTFISRVSNHLFDDIIYSTVWDIVAYRNVRVDENGNTTPYVNEFTLIKPSQFQVKTAMDLLEEFSEGSKANFPGFVRKKMILDFVDKRFGGDEVFQKKAFIIAELDDINVYSVDERLTMRTSGEIDIKDCIFSIKLPFVLDQIIREKSADWFLKAKFDAVKQEIDVLMEPLLVKASADFQVRDPNGNQDGG